jgi:hypothetical protein
LFGLGSHVSFRKPEGGDPGMIKPPGHLANFVSAALQRKNPEQDECAHDIISAEIGVPLQLLDVPDNPVCFFVAVSRVVFPVGSSRFAEDIGQEIDKINRPRVLDIEEGFLPVPARL